MDFIILANKPEGITSSQFLNQLKEKIKEKKLGHSGTLDKFATGLLVCACGKFTKILAKISKDKKEYIAEIEFGKESLTYDREGPFKKITDDFPTKKEIEKIVFSFPKNQYFYQEAPPFCAKKHEGKRLSDLARKNQFIFKKTKVKIFDWKILDYKPPILKIILNVSSGFYVRSFAHKLGEISKAGAYLKSLLRIKINDFSLERAIKIEDFEDGFLEIEGFVKKIPFDLFQERLNDKINFKVKEFEDRIYFILQGNFFELKNFLEKLKKDFGLAAKRDYLFYLQKPKKI